jgi:copper chaperone
MERTSLRIDGMSCGHCVQAVKRALAGLDGVEVEAVEIGSARIRLDAARVGRERVTSVVEDEGFSVRDWNPEG